MYRLLLFLAAFLTAIEFSSAFFLRDMKVDCVVSVWSEWGPTTNGYRTRNRKVYLQPQNGGALCPKLSETDKDIWVENLQPVNKAFTLVEYFLSGPDTLYSARKRRQTEVKDRDILFIVDSSGSISYTLYRRAMNNLANLIGKICGTIGPGKQHNQAALVIYSNNVREIFDFDDYDNLEDLQDAVRNVKHLNGGTCTGKALDFAQTMFTRRKGMRSHTVKEVVILTDGKSNCGPDVREKAGELRKRSPAMSTFVFAIGNYDDEGKKEMESMASSPISRHLFHFVSDTDFDLIVNQILTHPPECYPFVIR